MSQVLQFKSLIGEYFNNYTVAVVAFCAALIGVVAVGAKAEITASVPAGAHWRASPEGMPLWGPNRFWPGSGLVLRCLGPGFTVLALGPGFRPIIIVITLTSFS